MVLCAGLGTRLRPLTDELPKPLVPIGDRPLLARIASTLAGSGLTRLVLNTHHLPDAFPKVLAEFSLEAHVIHEPEIRGTAGGVAGARHRLGPPPVLVWNGDILADPPIDALLDLAGDGLALCVAPRPPGEGTVGLGEGGWVVRLRGECFGRELASGDFIGISALGERCLSSLPEQGCLIGDWALPELRRGARIATVSCSAAWTDIGDLRSYLELNLAWLGTRHAWAAEGAAVAPGVHLKRAIVGRGARVEGEGIVARSVVWPGAVARAPLADAIVTTSGRVVAIGSVDE
jgi:mannose-1-phosphate guanylyltransferase